MSLELKLSNFVNKAQTKLRVWTKELHDVYDSTDKNSEEAQRLLDYVSELGSFLDILARYEYGGLTDKEISQYIDFFSKLGGFKKIPLQNYTSYSFLAGADIVVANQNYALASDLATETQIRADADTAINALIATLQASIPTPATVFPVDFFDIQVASSVNVWDDDARLHTHANKALLDTYTQTEAALADAVAKAHSNLYDPTPDEKDALAGTNGLPSDTNKYVTNSDPRNSDARTPTAHIHTIGEITSLQTQLDTMTDLINAMAGIDGKDPEFQLNGTNLEWRYVGESVWNDLGDLQGLQGNQGDPFTVGAKGLDSERFDVLYDGEDDQFTFLALDTGLLYYRDPLGGNATDPGGWEEGIQFLGDKGWSPLIKFVEVSATKTVAEIYDWIGGSGDKPYLDPGANPPDPVHWYIGLGGPTTDISLAVNMRGPVGPTGSPFLIGAQGTLANRANFDDEPQGFAYLRTDTSPYTLFFKESDASADWSVEYPWQGQAGVSNQASNVVVVAKSGGQYTTLSDGLNAASAGQLVRVFPGTYTLSSQILLRNGVNIELMAGAIIDKTSGDGAAFYDNGTNVTCKVFGKGQIKNSTTGGSNHRGVDITGATSNVQIEVDIVSTEHAVSQSNGTLKYLGRAEVTGANQDVITKSGGDMILKGGTELKATGTGLGITAGAAQDVVCYGIVVANADKHANITILIGMYLGDTTNFI